jgi:hypothetical protein
VEKAMAMGTGGPALFAESFCKALLASNEFIYLD